MNISWSRERKRMQERWNARCDDRAKIEEKRKKKDQKIKADDEKYVLIVKLLRTELLKRDIDISDKDFDQKLDEIIRYCFSKFPTLKRRYVDNNISKDAVRDIGFAVKRSINRERFSQIDDSMEK